MCWNHLAIPSFSMDSFSQAGIHGERRSGPARHEDAETAGSSEQGAAPETSLGNVDLQTGQSVCRQLRWTKNGDGFPPPRWRDKGKCGGAKREEKDVHCVQMPWEQLPNGRHLPG